MNTRRTFNLAGNAGLGRIILVNKCDLDNINFDGLLDSIRETFGNACVPLNLPIGLGPKFSGVVSTLEVPASVPAGIVADPADWNQAVMDAIVEADESLMERYLEREPTLGRRDCRGLSKAGRRRHADSDLFRQLQNGRRRARADGRTGPLRSLAARAAAQGQERRRRRSADRSGGRMGRSSPRSSRRESTRSSPR